MDIQTKLKAYTAAQRDRFYRRMYSDTYARDWRTLRVIDPAKFEAMTAIANLNNY